MQQKKCTLPFMTVHILGCIALERVEGHGTSVALTTPQTDCGDQREWLKESTDGR